MAATRRGALALLILSALGLGTGFLVPRLLRTAEAEGPVELEWEQLIQRSGWLRASASDLVPRGVVQHGQLTATPDLGDAAGLVGDYDGKRVRIPGYMLPIGFDGVSAKEFLLVPYVGACIHVPPPPPNQIVYVTSDKPVRVVRQFEPVLVTGVMAVGVLSTDLADVGYRIAADTVAPYAAP